MSRDSEHAESPNPPAMPQPGSEPAEGAREPLSRGMGSPGRPRVARERLVLLLLAVMAVAISFPLLPGRQPVKAGIAVLPPTDTVDPNSPPPTSTSTPESPLATPTPTQANAGVPAAPAGTVPTQPAFVTSTPTTTGTPPAPGATATWTPVLPQDQFVPSLPQQQGATFAAIETPTISQFAPQPAAAATPLPGTGLVPPPPPAQVMPTVPTLAPPPTPTPILGIVVVPPPARESEPVADRSLDLALFIDNLVIAFGYVWIGCGLLLLPLAVIGGFLLARRPRQTYTPVHIPSPPQPTGPQTGTAPPPPTPPPAPPPPVKPSASDGSQRVAARHRSNGGNGGNDSERPPG